MLTYEEWFEGQPTETREMLGLHLHGLTSALQKERDARAEARATVTRILSEAVTKTEGGKAFPASDYAYVPDRTKPSTWKLRLTKVPGGPPDSGIVGAAAAALGPGFRGRKVQIPAGDLAAVKAKVRAAWKKANPDKDADEMPPGIKESEETMEQDFAGDFVPLVEKSVSDDGTVAVKLIQPGWGTSGYYSPELLERDGPPVFQKGTKMFWDHPTLTEDRERPERSLRDLAAELTGDARWDEGGTAGPGLYADAVVFDSFKGAVNELAPHIGVSILARGKAKMGEAEGREGKIIEELVAARSVDFVTEPGAGGQVLQLFESARREPSKGDSAVPQKQEVKQVDEKEAQALRDANAELTKNLDAAKVETQRLGEATLLREARDFVASTLKEVEMPDMTRERLVGLLANRPVLKDGVIDEAGYKAAIETAVKAELAYLSKVAGSGVIKGMGSETLTETVNVEESYVSYFRGQGLGAEQAEKMAALAAEGGK